MILLNSEKQCIYMYKGRRAAAAYIPLSAAAAAEEEEVSLGVIMTNTEIFHVFHIFSQFSTVFSKTFHYSTWVSSIFSLSFHNFLLYFPNLITVQLGFVPYFSYHFTIPCTYRVVSYCST